MEVIWTPAVVIPMLAKEVIIAAVIMLILRRQHPAMTLIVMIPMCQRTMARSKVVVEVVAKVEAIETQKTSTVLATTANDVWVVVATFEAIQVVAVADFLVYT
jgi:hypothetical protein